MGRKEISVDDHHSDRDSISKFKTVQKYADKWTAPKGSYKERALNKVNKGKACRKKGRMGRG